MSIEVWDFEQTGVEISRNNREIQQLRSEVAELKEQLKNLQEFCEDVLGKTVEDYRQERARMWLDEMVKKHSVDPA
jgi:cell division protein FtsB